MIYSINRRRGDKFSISFFILLYLSSFEDAGMDLKASSNTILISCIRFIKYLHLFLKSFLNTKTSHVFVYNKYHKKINFTIKKINFFKNIYTWPLARTDFESSYQSHKHTIPCRMEIATFSLLRIPEQCGEASFRQTSNSPMRHSYLDSFLLHTQFYQQELTPFKYAVYLLC